MTDKRDLIPAEDSIPLRVAVYLMTMTCILSSCFFIKTAWPVIVLSSALASIGSVVAYQNRNEKQSWMQWVVIVGVLAVGANAAAEFMDPSNGATDFWGPIVHFVAGTFALHTFDLKSRSDINLSAMLGAIILCFLAPSVRSVYFGLTVFFYICVGTVMLYFDCMSRTLHNWLSKPMQPAPLVDVANISGRRKPRGSIYLTLGLLPLLSAFCFLLLPRADNLVDNIMSNLKHLDFNSVMKMLPTFQPSMPDVPVPRHDFDGKKIKYLKKNQTNNKDEVDKELQKRGIETRKIIKVKDKTKEDKTKEEKKDKDKKNPNKNPPKKKPPAKHNEGPTERIKNNRPKDNKLGLDALDLDTDPPDSTVLVYRVTSSRLFFSRRTVFDEFDGRKWKRSKDKIKPTDIDVKDPAAVPDPKAANTPNPQEPDTATATATGTGTEEKELTPEEEADKELQQEKLAELSKRDTGFGPDMAVQYIFKDPPKGQYKVSDTAGLRLPPKLPCITLNQSFEVQSDVDKLFPSAWIAQNLAYKGKSVIVDDYGEMRNVDNLKKGTKFNVTSQWPVYNLKTMRLEPGISEDRENQIRDELGNYLQLPDDLSDEVLDTANTMAGKTGNWFVTAERICMQLRTACTMEMDKPVDYEPAEDRVKDFLITRKTGNDKDFATAYVIMCRSVGLPARVVYGFNPGSFDKASGTQEIRMTDTATWAEVYIPDYGWVPFDPSPGGVMPGVKRDEGFSFWNVLKWICKMLGIDLDEEGFTPKKILALVSIAISLLFLIAGLILGIMLFLKWRRDRQSKNPWQDAAWRVWRDLAQDFKKARMERMETETPTEFVERINKIVKDQRQLGAMTSYELPQILGEFFVNYEAVHFGNKEGLPVLKEQAQELRKLLKANKGSEKTAEAATKAVRGGRR